MSRDGEETSRKSFGSKTKLRVSAAHVAPPPLIPEQKLCIEVLKTAITDFLGRQTCEMTQADKRDARNFIFKDECSDGWNFSYLCECVGLDAIEIRKALVRIIQTQQSEELVKKLKAIL